MTSLISRTEVKGDSNVTFVITVSFDKHGFFIVSVYEDKETSVVFDIERFEIFDKKAAINKQAALIRKYVISE